MKERIVFAFVSALVIAAGPLATAQGIISTTHELPPDGVYLAIEDFFEYSAAGIILDAGMFFPLFEPPPIITGIGNDELETYESRLEGTEIGLGLGPLSFIGPSDTLTLEKNIRSTGLFDTEMVSMDLVGSSPLGDLFIREDPNRASLGQTDITDIGGGLYHIDSFFDIFTELSVDGGQSWIPSDGATRITLYDAPIPEPSLLVALPLLILVLPKRRRG